MPQLPQGLGVCVYSPYLIDLGFQSDAVLAFDVRHDVQRQRPDFSTGRAAVVDEHQGLSVVHTTRPAAVAFPARSVDQPPRGEFHLAVRSRIMRHLRVLTLNALEGLLIPRGF